MQDPGIGVPFNVQHVAHIGTDNVEALLLAAKDDPKLLPSFLLPEGLVDEKEGGKKSVEIDDTKPGECKSITSCAEHCIVKVYCFKPLCSRVKSLKKR